MARGVNRGEIWLYEFRPPDKRRPVVVLTRAEVIPLLRTVMVAPITSTIRGAPSEVQVGVDEGLKHDSAVNLDHVQTVEKSRLRTFVGSLGREKMRQVCRALAIATDCADGGSSADRPGPALRN
jgi:mRNA interferase MazF